MPENLWSLRESGQKISRSVSRFAGGMRFTRLASVALLLELWRHNAREDLRELESLWARTADLRSPFGLLLIHWAQRRIP